MNGVTACQAVPLVLPVGASSTCAACFHLVTSHDDETGECFECDDITDSPVSS